MHACVSACLCLPVCLYACLDVSLCAFVCEREREQGESV